MLVPPLIPVLSKKFNCNTSCMKRLSTVSWSNKLFVNYLKPPTLFGPTGEEIVNDVDLTNKTCLITGGTSGIGAEMVRCLMAKNCNIIMACRNPYKAHVLSKTVWNDPSKLTIYKTNLTSFASVKKTSEELLKNEKKIDIVLLNAAVFGLPWTLTEDGFETLFQVNYLSQLYLLLNIEDMLAPNARVVFMSSDSHRNLNWTIDDIIAPTSDLICLPQEKYTSIKAYNTTKLCGILAMHYLCYRWSKKSRAIFCAHPGSFVKTNLCINWWPYEALYTIMYPFSKSIEQAAATPLYCATSPDLQGLTDLYFKDRKECEVSDLAHDTRLAFRIADLSQSLIMDATGYDEDLATETEVEQIETAKAEHITDPAKPEMIESESVKPELTKPDLSKPETSKSSIEEPVLST